MTMRCAVWRNACFHCAPVRPSTKPETIAATNTPVPAADTQLSVNCAPSGLALAGATGGMRWTSWCSAGISHLGADAPPNRVLSQAFLSPHTTQHAIRIAHGSQAWMVSPSPYLYVHCLASTVVLAPASRSERSRNRALGCQTK